MKKLLLVFWLFFLIGCGPSAFQVQMNNYNSRLQRLETFQNMVISKSDQVKVQEVSFIKQLDNNQLAVYQNAIQVFRSGDLPSQEMARRNLQQVCDVNEYSTAIHLLEQKAEIQRDCSEIESEYAVLRQMLANIDEQENRRQDAVRDYMLINAVRSNC